MEILHNITYDQSLNQLLPFYLEPKAIEKKLLHLGSRDIHIEKESDNGSQYKLKVDREVAVSPPKAIARFFQSWTKITQEETWNLTTDEQLESRIEVKIPGLPISLNTKIVMTADENCCHQKVKTSVKCSLPLIGKIMEKFIAEDLNRNIEAEASYIKASLD